MNDLRKICARLSLPDGVTKPYRPKPADFREVYIAIGWDGIEEHYGTNWRVIRRWIEEEGREELRKARAAYVRKRRKRYVLGRTLRPVGTRPLREIGALPDDSAEPEILALQGAGMSVKSIAKRLRVSQSRVYAVLHENGIYLTAVKRTNGKG